MDAQARPTFVFVYASAFQDLKFSIIRSNNKFNLNSKSNPHYKSNNQKPIFTEIKNRYTGGTDVLRMVYFHVEYPQISYITV